jgi:hypothetical protein
MPDKQLITVPLNELRSSDIETIGSVFPRDGKLYKWVKNGGTTALAASGCCIVKLTSVEAAVGCRVISADGAGVSTGAVAAPAGVPITAIGASGATLTGDHGWIQVKGITSVRVMQSSVGTQQNIGGIMLATSANPSTNVWDMPIGGVSTAYNKKLLLMSDYVASTGPATFITMVVSVQCAD